MDYVVLLIILIVLLYFISKKRAESDPLDSFSRLKETIPLNGENLKEYSDRLEVGNKINLWASKKENGEVRAYVLGEVGGKGLVSVFQSSKIYKLLNKVKSSNDRLNVTIVRIQRTQMEVEIELIRNVYNEEEHINKWSSEVQKPYRPKPGTKFRARFTVNLRIPPNEFNQDLGLAFNCPREQIHSIASKIISHQLERKQFDNWLNEIFWLEYKGEKISLENNTNVSEVKKILRSFISGYEFNVEIQKTSSDTQLESKLIKSGFKDFIYYFSIVPVKYQ